MDKNPTRATARSLQRVWRSTVISSLGWTPGGLIFTLKPYLDTEAQHRNTTVTRPHAAVTLSQLDGNTKPMSMISTKRVWSSASLSTRALPVRKPFAFPVSVRRKRSFAQGLGMDLPSRTACGCSAPRSSIRTAYIALGSNLGDRVNEIEKACKEMASRGIKVKRTSNLWETEPMYVLDQDRFVNGACEVRQFNPVVFASFLTC